MKRSTVISLLLALAVLALASAAGAAVTTEQMKKNLEAEAWAAENPQACALLDSPKAIGVMDGLLLKLAVLCGRPDLLGAVLAEEGEKPGESRDTLGVDVLVNNPAGDSGSSRTQSETSVARDETTGVLCSGYNDSYHGVTQNTGYTGFSSSTDGGATWTDHGAIGAASFGDPSVFWRRSNGHFYIGAIHSSGMGLWDLGTNCTSVTFVATPHVGAGDDKELFAVDNNPANPHYGRMYMAWTNFNDWRIYSTFSDNGTTWSTPFPLSTAGANVQGAWPVVASNGDVYVAWLRWNPFDTGPIDIEIARSTNGGVSFAPVTNPMTGKVSPRAASPSSSCGRAALNGNIRYLPSPQIAVGPDGALHVVYSYDPDGFNTGDVVNVYYRRSIDNGATWGAEVLLNDDATTRDQFFPSLSVGPTNIVSAAWYDRRNDAGNLLFQYFQRMSFDGGATWDPSVLLSDAASPVILDPNLATCYHGDYDTQIQTPAVAIVIWADDRTVSAQSDPNVWNDTVAISTDFLLTSDPAASSVCAPTSATYTINVLQFSGFTEAVTLSASGNPAGSTVGFAPNPVTPPGSSTLTITTTGVATGTSTITVTGTSSPSSIVHSTDVTLSVFAGSPSAAMLTAPANGAINVAVRPAFAWTAATGAEDYLVEVASDPGFGSIVYTATVAGTTHTPGSDLPSNTHLYWRVTANNPCGSTLSAAFSFTTVALPGDCATGSVPNLLYDYGFEAGLNGWTSSGTGNTWALTTTPAYVHSGTQALHATDPTTVSDQRLVSPSVVLPTGQDPVVLRFWNSQSFESTGTGTCWDGGIVEISTNGGTTWTQIPGANLLTDPYDGPIESGSSNPLAGLSAWCGDPQAYLRSIVDLTAWAGQTVKLRFRLGSDVSVGRPDGWNLDDVAVQSCVVDTMPFLDGFETGDTSRWSSTVP